MARRQTDRAAEEARRRRFRGPPNPVSADAKGRNARRGNLVLQGCFRRGYSLAVSSTHDYEWLSAIGSI